jgi:hypothetical protein
MSKEHGPSSLDPTDSRYFYPNFSRYYGIRTAPAAERLLTDKVMRSAIFHRNDEDLAVILNDLDTAARNEGSRFAGWHGYPQSVADWVREHLPLSE